MRPPATLGARERSQRFTVLNLEGISLLMPLQEVLSVESVLDIDTTQSADGAVGAVHSAGSWCPVFSLSDNLEPTPTLSSAFRVCAILARGDMAFGIACRSVSTLDGVLLTAHPVPECMRTAASPVRALAYQDEQLYCCTSFVDLAPLLWGSR